MTTQTKTDDKQTVPKEDFDKLKSELETRLADANKRLKAAEDKAAAYESVADEDDEEEEEGRPEPRNSRERRERRAEVRRQAAEKAAMTRERNQLAIDKAALAHGVPAEDVETEWEKLPGHLRHADSVSLVAERLALNARLAALESEAPKPNGPVPSGAGGAPAPPSFPSGAAGLAARARSQGKTLADALK